MATFTDRVAAFSGSISDSNKLPFWLSDGARDVIMRVRLVYPEQLSRFATEGTVDDTTGYTATNGGLVLSLYTSSGVSTEIAPEERFHVLNTNSIKKATTLFPKHWVLNGVYFIAADGATVDGNISVVELYRAIAASDESISDFATEYEYLVAIYAGIQNIINKLNTTELPDSIALPDVDLGDDISITPLTVTAEPPETIISVIDEGEVEDIGSPPVFIAPILSLTVMPDIDSFDLPAVPDLDFTLSKSLTAAVKATKDSFPAFSLPTKPVIDSLDIPAAPDIDFTLSSNLTAAVKAVIGNFPAFTLPDTPTISEIDFGDITAPTAPTDPSFSSLSLVLPEIPTYTPPTNTLNIATALSQVETDINTTQDLEIAVQNLNKISTLTNEYVTRTNDAVNTFNEENAVFQGALQKVIKEAELLNTYESSEYAAKLQKYATQVNAYSSQISGLVSVFSANSVQYKVIMWQTESQMRLAVFQAQMSAVLSQYSSDIQNNTTFTGDEVKLFSAEMSEHAQKNQNALALYASQTNSLIQKWNLTEVQQKQAQWQIECQMAIAVYQAEMSAILNQYSNDIQNNGAFTNDEVKLFTTELSEVIQKNQNSLGLYTTQSNVVIQKWNSTEIQQKQAQWIAERNTELNKYQLDIQSAFNSFTEENTRYQTLLQKHIKEADNRQSASIETVKSQFQNLAIEMEQYKIAVDIEIQAALQVIGSEITQWSQKRTTLLQKFATEMSGWIQNYQTKLQAYVEERSTLIARLTALTNQYEKAWVPFKETK